MSVRTVLHRLIDDLNMPKALHDELEETEAETAKRLEPVPSEFEKLQQQVADLTAANSQPPSKAATGSFPAVKGDS